MESSDGRSTRACPRLAQTISTLSRLCGIVPTVPWGLTEACHTCCAMPADPLTPVEVRDRLLGIGVDLSRVFERSRGRPHDAQTSQRDGGDPLHRRLGRDARAFIWERPARAAGLSPAVAQVAKEMRVTGSGRKKK